VSGVVCAAMVLAEVLEDPTPVRVSLIYLGSAINIGLGAQDLWRGKPGERLPSGRLSAMVYAGYAFSTLVIVPLPILYPIQFEGNTPISEWLTYSSMLLLVFNLLAFLMAMVLKLERGGEVQRQLAERDHLTGLFNRRMFLHQAARLSEKPGTAIAVIDLDHFKRINDTYGHKAGDDALVQFAERASRLLPEKAVFGRLGGEEFGICLPNQDRESAWTTINSIRLAVAAEDIETDHHHFRLTLSCGMVITDTPLRSLDAWMALADAGLYAAKDQGRNRVVLQEPHLPKDERSTPPLQLAKGDWENAARLSA
jgi:diguanylate cyclase (GGDEF)-like protein